MKLTVAQRKNVLATADAKCAQRAPVYLAWFDYNAPLFNGRIRAGEEIDYRDESDISS